MGYSALVTLDSLRRGISHVLAIIGCVGRGRVGISLVRSFATLYVCMVALLH